jgi:hypothetical protein
MTPSEFKAWFDGFTEAFEGRIPTKAQWGRIKDRVAEIDGKAVTERVYVDRYYPAYVKTYPVYSPTWTTTTCRAVGASSSTSYSLAAQGSNLLCNGNANLAKAFNSSQAMAELGRAEGKALS